MSAYIYPPPNDGKPFKLAMGLRTLEPHAWLEGGSDLCAQLSERDRLISLSPEIIYGEIPGYEDEISYFCHRIVENLREYHATFYEFTDRSVMHKETGLVAELSADNPLLELTRVVAEDFCVLHKIDRHWTLVAGAVLFPSRWILSEKLGKSLDQIHAPVPGYESALQPYMTATFDKITSTRPVWRKNWSLHSTSDLHQPVSIHHDTAPQNYWWRTERQTLTRSPESESILFTIRNRAEPLSWILSRSDEARAFAETLQSMSPETIGYKGLTSSHQDIVRALMLSQ